MTTVAFKGGILAFDSKVTSGGVHHGWTVKGKKTSKYIMACAGSLEDIQAFMDWMESGGSQDEKKKFGLADREIEVQALVVSKKGEVIHYESRLYPYVVNSEFHAIGSGADLAIGAMAFGASASQAVKIASKFDVYTGGNVREISWTKK